MIERAHRNRKGVTKLSGKGYKNDRVSMTAKRGGGREA